MASHWGVFPHCEEGTPTGRGYVVRECFGDGQLSHASAYHYGGIAPLRVYVRRRAAECFADRLTDAESIAVYGYVKGGK